MSQVRLIAFTQPTNLAGVQTAEELVAATADLGLLFKIMWKIFMFGWELV